MSPNAKQGFFLKSRLARYTFFLFTGAALLPVLYIAYLSYDRVSEQLREQSFEQSRQLAKSLGMELFRRIESRDSALRRLTADYAFNGNPNLQDLTMFEDLWIHSEQGVTKALKGVPTTIPVLTSAQHAFIAEGRTVLAIRSDVATGGSAHLLLFRGLPKQTAEQSLLVASLPLTVMETLKELMPGSSELMLAGPESKPIFVSRNWLISVRTPLAQALSSAVSGYFDWEAETSAQLVAYWSLFTAPEYQFPGITVLVSADRAEALAPITRFRSVYLPVLILVVMCVALVTAQQLRRRLMPLVELRDATQQVAKGQLGVQLAVRGDDEIADLGNAFNDMTAKLESQFSSLEAMAALDREILASFDSRQIVETVVVHAGEMTDCQLVAMLELGDDPEDECLLSYTRQQDSDQLGKTSINLSAGDKSQLERAGGEYLETDAASPPDFLSILGGHSQEKSAYLVLPILLEDKLAAALIFGFEPSALPASEERAQLRQFADHITVAFTNARWEARLFEQAHYDDLTGLPNRVLLHDRLSQALNRAERSAGSVAVMFLDLDEFKLVNDSLGHAAGDKLLKICGERIVSRVRGLDTVVRFGGDEFVVVIPDLDASADSLVSSADGLALDILETLADPIVIDGVEMEARASIGIALYPDDGVSSEQLLAHADAAMYNAKGAGRNRHRFFRPEMNEEAMRRLGFREEVRRAIQQDEFRLYYQPKFDCLTDELVGAEALIRWQHPERGFVPPMEFIELAETMGSINEIGAWTLQRACSDVQSWIADGLRDIKVSVNLSPRQFRDSDVVAIVREQLDAHGLEPGRLELEVTETAVMDDTRQSIDILRHLHELGVSLSIDDFGTGYSSLGYLKDLAVDVLKIDQSFTRTMLSEPRVEAIVATIISLAHNLDLKVIAEGVETLDEKAKLLELGCDLCQGYLYSKPVPVEEFTRMLQEVSGQTSALEANCG